MIISRLITTPLFLLLTYLGWGQHAPTVGDSLYIYTYTSQKPIEDLANFQFYELDFPCHDKIWIKASDIPRVDYLYEDQYGLGAIYSVVDSMLVQKGFKITDPYFGESVKLIQLIGGIPTLNLAKANDFNNTGEQSFYLEYNVEDLPEELMLWAGFQEYTKLRIKSRIDYTTSYIGSALIPISEDLKCDKLKTSYSIKVEEVQMKSEDWKIVSVSTIPNHEQYFQSNYTEYVTYHAAADPYGILRVWYYPEIKLEYRLQQEATPVPVCNKADSQVYVYPNPTLGDLNVRMIDVEEGAYTFSLYNIIGHEVWTTELNLESKEHFRLRLPNLEKGVYLYSIKDDKDRYVQSKRLTVLEH